MRFPQRRAVADVPPGRFLQVHNHRDLATLLNRDLTDSLVVIDQRDLDAETAQLILDRRPFAVLNAAEFISGRFANLGPEILARAGIQLFEAGRSEVYGLTDRSQLRLHEATLYDGAVVALDLRPLTLEGVRVQMDQARSGLMTQLDSFAHTTSEFLRREQDLLLHGRGAPEVRVKLAGRPVVVIGPVAKADDLAPLKVFLREQKPAVIAVDGGAEAAVGLRIRPDVVILSGAGTVQPKTLAQCREVVLTGSGEAVRRRAEQANLPVHDAQTTVTGLDLGLLMAQRGLARVVIPVGYPATLEDFIDRSRSSQASNVLTRLRVGSVLVEASAVPLLYSGKVRRWQVALIGLASAGVLALSVLTTPVGQDWADQARDAWESVR